MGRQGGRGRQGAADMTHFAGNQPPKQCQSSLWFPWLGPNRTGATIKRSSSSLSDWTVQHAERTLRRRHTWSSCLSVPQHASCLVCSAVHNSGPAHLMSGGHALFSRYGLHVLMSGWTAAEAATTHPVGWAGLRRRSDRDKDLHMGGLRWWVRSEALGT